jgi:hypothetical protein
MTEESISEKKEEAIQRLKELVLDHLGIPRPKQSAHIQTLQDELLPAFLDLARHAWLASSPLPLKTGMSANEPSHPVYRYLQQATQTRPEEIRKLNDILEELGVHAMLEAVASSPDKAVVGELPVDDYDSRLLREAGERNPESAIREFLRYSTKHPHVLADSETQLEKAGEAMLQAHRDINIVINVSVPTQDPPPPAANVVPTAKPKRRKVVLGLAKLASGLVLLSGNGIVIPTVAISSPIALPVLGSLAAGIAAVGEGVSHFLREGE